MIPMPVEAHLRLSHPGFEHHRHTVAMTAQDLAAAEHVSGRHVAKPVIVKLDGRLAIAVVAASERVDLRVREEATGAAAELVPEVEFAARFQPCDAGAEPPLALFGLPIFVDAKLESQRTLVMPGGTHEDSVVLDTREWMRCEKAEPIVGLGAKLA